MLSNNLIIIKPKLFVLNNLIHDDKREIDNRMKNTYYSKIIGVNINNEIKKIYKQIDK
jgi:hypothetical protein